MVYSLQDLAKIEFTSDLYVVFRMDRIGPMKTEEIAKKAVGKDKIVLMYRRPFGCGVLKYGTTQRDDDIVMVVMVMMRMVVMALMEMAVVVVMKMVVVIVVVVMMM